MNVVISIATIVKLSLLITRLLSKVFKLMQEYRSISIYLVRLFHHQMVKKWNNPSSKLT